MTTGGDPVFSDEWR